MVVDDGQKVENSSQCNDENAYTAYARVFDKLNKTNIE